MQKRKQGTRKGKALRRVHVNGIPHAYLKTTDKTIVFHPFSRDRWAVWAGTFYTPREIADWIRKNKCLD
jgi:hypothetical protein